MSANGSVLKGCGDPPRAWSNAYSTSDEHGRPLRGPHPVIDERANVKHGTGLGKKVVGGRQPDSGLQRLHDEEGAVDRPPPSEAHVRRRLVSGGRCSMLSQPGCRGAAGGLDGRTEATAQWLVHEEQIARLHERKHVKPSGELPNSPLVRSATTWDLGRCLLPRLRRSIFLRA
eukprot:scaffold8766_cov119-Isochrysis_galbana.AAC.1